MTHGESKIQVTVEEQERWRRIIRVTVPASIVEEEERRTARHLASGAELRGFRKGRVPARVIESQYGSALRREALDRLINSAYREALAAQGLRPISKGEFLNLQYEPEQDLTFAIAFDVAPVIEIGRLGGLTIERTTAPVTDKDLDTDLTRIREQKGVWRPVEDGLPEEGNRVSVNIIRLGDDADREGKGRDCDLILGRGDVIPDIEEAIKTLELGASREFDITCANDLPDKTRRSDAVRVRITLTGRCVLDVPELDDEFARQVGDFKTLEELTTRVREELQRQADKAAEERVRERLLDLLIEANPFEVPQSMIDRYTDSISSGQEIADEKRADIRARVRTEAERAVKRILIVDRVGETQGLGACQEEVDQRIAGIAKFAGTDPSQVYADLQKAGRLEAIERELTEEKVFAFLKGQSRIIDSDA